jgi:hypothetical protein
LEEAMTELSFTPTFHHADWVDNVDRVQAGGPNGFNVRLTAIEADLRQVSTVVGQIDAAIDQLSTGSPQATQRTVIVPLRLVSRRGSLIAPAAGWGITTTGVAFPDSDHRGAGAVQDLALPDGARLLSFRVRGLFAGGDVSLEYSIVRASISDGARPVDVLGTVSSTDQAFTNPYDLTVNLDPQFATVDNAGFRYVFTALANLFDQAVTVNLSSLHLTYSA